jgi:hypothetical protein
MSKAIRFFKRRKKENEKDVLTCAGLSICRYGVYGVQQRKDRHAVDRLSGVVRQAVT